MAQVIVTESSLENIAGAIRAKLGTQATYKPAQMAGAIAQIHGDPVLEALNVNANGTYTPSSGKDGFSQAVVNVPNSYSSGDEGKVVSGGALVAQSSQSITQNGTYDTTLKNQVTVNVSGGGGGGEKGFELYGAGFEGYTQNFKGFLDNKYFVCFFHDNMQTYYDLNAVRNTFSYISSGYNCDLIGETKEVSNIPSTELHSILSHNGSSFTSYHKDSGSYCTLVGGWVGYPTGGTIYGNLANAITNSITMNSAHDKLLILVAGSKQNMTQNTIDINGTSYTITNMGSRFDNMYNIYAAIEIENNTDTTITVTFPMQCWNFLSIIGLD